MKKFFLVCMVVIMVLGLVACKKNNVDENVNVGGNEQVNVNDNLNEQVDTNNNSGDEQPTVGSESVSDDEKNVDAEYLADYTGTWGTASEETGVNTRIEVTSNPDNTINFVYFCEQVSGMRVAVIEPKNVKLDANGAGAFTFEDDGHGNSGEGIITLSDSKVWINITNMNYAPTAAWGTSSGVYEIKK